MPGNQLYLPDLGIDLRECFRRSPDAPDGALSPATQAMLIAVLLREPWHAEWQPAEVARTLGYSVMTLSRAVKELTATGIASLHAEGMARWLHMDRTAADTWEQTKPTLHSPTKRRFWAKQTPDWSAPHVRLAGLSALARYSMLAELEWRRATKDLDIVLHIDALSSEFGGVFWRFEEPPSHAVGVFEHRHTAVAQGAFCDTRDDGRCANVCEDFRSRRYLESQPDQHEAVELQSATICPALSENSEQRYRGSNPCLPARLRSLSARFV